MEADQKSFALGHHTRAIAMPIAADSPDLQGSCIASGADRSFTRVDSSRRSSWWYDYRLGEVSLVVFFLLSGFLLSQHQNELYIPENMAAIDYPIKVDTLNKWFTAKQIRAVCTANIEDDALAALRYPICIDSLACASVCEHIKNGGGHWKGATVSVPALFGISVGLPLLLFSLHKVFVKKPSTAMNNKQAKGPVVGLFLSFAFAYCITSWLKCSVGRPRPNFYAIREQALAKASSEGSIAEYHDAYRSFPSGHASVSMACLFYTSLWLLSTLTDHVHTSTNTISPITCCSPSKQTYAKAMLPDPRQRELLLMVLTYVSFAPTVLAIWVASTRVVDYWHNYSDIMFGMMIGAAAAVIAYRTTFETNIASAAPPSFIKNGKPLAPLNVGSIPADDRVRKWIEEDANGSRESSPNAGSGLLPLVHGLPPLSPPVEHMRDPARVV
jgi:membrane-associated phospholipid phosphatase